MRDGLSGLLGRRGEAGGHKALPYDVGIIPMLELRVCVVAGEDAVGTAESQGTNGRGWVD